MVKAPTRRAKPKAGAPSSDEGAGAGIAPLDPGPLSSYPGYLLARAQIALRQGLDGVLAGFAIRRVQFTILMMLKHNPGARPADLAESLVIKRANMVGLIDELCVRKLVVKRARRDDGRSLALHLTAAGRRLIDSAGEAVEVYETGVRATLEDGRAGFYELLSARLKAIASGTG